MKKTLSMILVLVLCLALCACGSGSTGTTTESPFPTTTAPQKTEHIMTEEEIFAAEILIASAKAFINPLSINVRNVWVYSNYNPYNSAYEYKFTYEFDVKNSGGISETVFFGTSKAIPGLDDETLRKVLSDIKYSYQWNGSDNDFFKENKIEAMQKGVKLDAESIQKYFMMNYK